MFFHRLPQICAAVIGVARSSVSSGAPSSASSPSRVGSLLGRLARPASAVFRSGQACHSQQFCGLLVDVHSAQR